MEETIRGHLNNALQMLSLARQEDLPNVQLMLPAIEDRVRNAVAMVNALAAELPMVQHWYAREQLAKRL